MSNPITWRTIIGPSLADAARPMELARIGLNDAFGAFGNVVQGAEVAQANNVTALDEAAKQDYLNRLSSTKSPEELAALQSSGQLDAIRRSLLPASQAAVRGADEARLTSLRQQITGGQQFNAGQTDITEQPQKDAALALATNGRFDEAVKAVDGSTIRNKAPLYSAIEQARRTKTLQGREDATFANTEATRDITLKTAKLNLTEAERAAAEAETSRKLEARVAAAAAERQTETAPVRAKLEEIASQIPDIPRNTDGSVAVDRLTTAQKTVLNGHLGLAGMPKLESLTGDTAAAAKLRDQFRKEGVTPSQMAKLEPLFASTLSTAPVTPIGQDAAAAQRTMRALQVEEGAVRDQHGSLTYTGQKGDLMKVGTEIIGGIASGSGKERYTRALSQWLDKGGIPVGDKGERVLPSESQLRLLLGNIRTGWFYNAQSDISSLLDNWANSPEAQDGARQVLRVRDRNRILGIDPLGKQ